MAIHLKKKELTFLQKIYIVEIIKGLGITLRHLLKNMWDRDSMMTYQYPEEIKPIDKTHRSEHRLMWREDGSIRCTSCMLCATACPSNCIHITAAEGSTPDKEKYPSEFMIDHLRCVFCGFCVEACPCDAIRMDTCKPVSSNYHREDFIRNIGFLKNNHPEGLCPYSEGVY